MMDQLVRKPQELARDFEIDQSEALVEQFIKEPPMARGVRPAELEASRGGVPPISSSPHARL
jgi:hypothetical protein